MRANDVFSAIGQFISKYNDKKQLAVIYASLLIIFCYYLVKSVRQPNKKYSLLNFLLLNALIYLRPIFIFLVPILLVLWCYGLKLKKRPNFKLNTVLLASAIVLYLGYCSAFKSSYGLFGTSIVGTINQYDILRRFSKIDTDVIADKKMRQDIAKITNTDQSKINDPSLQRYDEYEKDYLYNVFFHRERDTIAARYGYVALNDLVKKNIKKHWREYLSTVGVRFTREMDRPAFNTPLSFARMVRKSKNKWKGLLTNR